MRLIRHCRRHYKAIFGQDGGGADTLDESDESSTDAAVVEGADDLDLQVPHVDVYVYIYIHVCMYVYMCVYVYVLYVCEFFSICRSARIIAVMLSIAAFFSICRSARPPTNV